MGFWSGMPGALLERQDKVWTIGEFEDIFPEAGSFCWQAVNVRSSLWEAEVIRLRKIVRIPGGLQTWILHSGTITQSFLEPYPRRADLLPGAPHPLTDARKVAPDELDKPGRL